MRLEKGLKPIVAFIYALALVLLGSGYLVLSSQLDQAFHDDLKEQLQNRIYATEQAVDKWVRARKREAVGEAQLALVSGAVGQLLPLSDNPQRLRAHPQQRLLRSYFAPYLASRHIDGFALLNPEGTVIAANSNRKVGEPNPFADQQDLFLAALTGKTVITRIQRNTGPAFAQAPIHESATNYVLTPVRDKQGSVRALLALQLIPQEELFTLVDFDPAGTMVQTYVFDPQGNLLSQVFNNRVMEQSGRWLPGNDRILVEFASDGLEDSSTLIEPVQRALTQEQGMSLTGYVNYAGQLSIGAWDFFPDLGFGFIAETPKESAFRLLNFYQRLTAIAFAIGFVVVSIVFFSMQHTILQSERQRRLLVSVMAATKDVNFLVNADGRIKNVNPAFREVFGHPIEMALDSHLDEFIDTGPGTRERLSGAALRRLGGDKSAPILRAKGRGKSDPSMPIGVSFEALSQSSDRDDFLVVVHDYREIERREADLREALQKAEIGNRTKASFLSTISHELRSPLISVISSLELIAARTHNKADRNMVDASGRSAQMLLGIIDDILDYARMETGNFELSPHAVVLENVLSDVSDILRWQANDNNVTLLPYCDPDLPVVSADGLRLRQILLNLVGNAIKFSSQMAAPGDVKVSIRATGTETNAPKIKIVVEDNGIGMSRNTTSQIFEPFTQAEGSIRRRYGGTGLGLSITQRLVHLMGGEITVSSHPGMGSTFEVTLPLKAENTETLDQPTQYQDKLAGARVLYSGNDTKIGEILDSYVSAAGGVLINESTITDPSEATDFSHVVVYGKDQPELLASNGSLGNLPVLRVIQPGGKLEDDGGAQLPLTSLLPSRLTQSLFELTGQQVEQAPAVEIPQTKVLLIEDDKMTREITLRMLEQLGIAADAVENGKEGLELWRSGAYSLLLSDCHMPIMDGFQMAAQIRDEEARRQLPKTPIVAVSADLTMEIEKLCKVCEIDQYVPKPMTPAKLKALMTSFAANEKGQYDA